MVQNKNKILLHACCGICSAYPISLLQNLDYKVIVYFCNPNLSDIEEFKKRLEAQEKVCNHYKCELIIESYNHLEYIRYINGLENEPEKGIRCDKCIELRLLKTAQKAKELNIKTYTTSLTISPHKNYEKILSIGEKYAQEFNLIYPELNFKKKDGFLKTNKISKELNLYRQNFCGCEFAKNKL